MKIDPEPVNSNDLMLSDPEQCCIEGEMACAKHLLSHIRVFLVSTPLRRSSAEEGMSCLGRGGV